MSPGPGSVSRAEKGEAALLKALGYTLKDIGTWQGGITHAAVQQRIRRGGANYAAACLVALRDNIQRKPKSRPPLPSAFGFRGRTYSEKVMELIEREIKRPPKPRSLCRHQPWTPSAEFIALTHEVNLRMLQGQTDGEDWQDLLERRERAAFNGT